MNRNDIERYQCIGCGIEIQTENPQEVGYLPNSALQKGIEKGDFYCQRCFKLRHYNELQDLEMSEDVFLEKVSQIASDDAYVIHMIDIFDVEGTLLSGLPRLIGQQDFAVVANKVDLLPKSTKLSRVKHWLHMMVKDVGLFSEDILLVAANKAHTLDNLIQFIEDKVRYQNVYIVGVTNVGKSTLINQLIQHFGGKKEIITTSNHPGTTLDLIQIPLTENTSLIDTPGIIYRSQMAHVIDRSDYQRVMPNKPIKPKVYQLNSGQTLFLGGLARIDYLNGPKMSMTLFVSQDLYIHRTKQEGAKAFYDKHLGGLLSPPSKEKMAQFPPLKKHVIQLDSAQDLTISGLGWLTVNEKIELEVWIPEGIQLTRRQSII